VAHLFDKRPRLFDAIEGRAANRHGLQRRRPFGPNVQCLCRSLQRRLGISSEILRKRQSLQPDEILRVVWIQPLPALKRIGSLGSSARIEVHNSQGKMTKGEARGQLDRRFGRQACASSASPCQLVIAKA